MNLPSTHQKGIVRVPISCAGKGRVVRPGTIVLVPNASVLKREASLAVVDDASAFTFWAPPKTILDYRRFLRDQPPAQFWALIDRHRLYTQQKDFFLSEPRTESYGPFPFRFESEGEVLHYIAHYEVRPQDLLLVQSHRRPHLTQTPVHRVYAKREKHRSHVPTGSNREAVL